MNDETPRFRLTETKGQAPNYFTLHCQCGDGFIWRTDGDQLIVPGRSDWADKHRAHATRT